MGPDIFFSNFFGKVNDRHQWKRIRSTLSPMFSTRQLNEMLDLSANALKQLVGDLDSLKTEKINAKVRLKINFPSPLPLYSLGPIAPK